MRVTSRITHFNPRAPCGARRCRECAQHGIRTFQSTRPVRGATSIICHANTPLQEISIHAPRAGRDRYFGRDDINLYNISIHAPRAGRDGTGEQRMCQNQNFNPRAPCGARHRRDADLLNRGHISIHAPRAGRDQDGVVVPLLGDGISIHAPRAGRDGAVWLFGQIIEDFNPRAPCGARRGWQRGENQHDQFQSTRPVRGATPLNCI